jgi:DNA-binding transcriptional ArsR family regulator
MSKYKKTENQDKGIEDETDSCEIFTYDEGKVNRLKKEVVQTEGLSTYFKALADDNRLKIIHALSREELCVRDVADIIGTTMQVASHHLRVLRDIGLVKNRKDSWCISAYRTNMHVRDLASNHYLALEHSKIALEPNHT